MGKEKTGSVKHVDSRIYQPAENDIVVIMFDQLSARWLEKASELKLTPHIDRLQSMGTTFPNAFSGTPICMPARSSMVTGMSARQHGVLTNGYVLNPDLPTYMKVLQKHGYSCGGFGKFHLYPEVAKEGIDYRTYGFDVVFKSEDWEKWSKGGFLERNSLERPGFFFAIKDEEKTQTAEITRRGLDFIRQADEKHPLYAFISYVEPHPPYTPPAGYTERIDIGSLPEAIEPAWAVDRRVPRDLFSGRAHWTPYHHYNEDYRTNPKEFWLRARQYYFADIVHLDEQVGRILSTLEETGRLDDTYILLTADHGDLLGDHGFCEKGWAHYDACIRIPMAVAGPGLRQGQIREEFVQLEDVFPTMLEMGGDLPARTYGKESIRERGLFWMEGSQLVIEEEPPPQLPGFPQSMLPLCCGEARKDWRTSAYIESYEGFLGSRWTRTIRNKRFRYTYFPGGGEQLFDLERDPDEIANSLDEPAHREIRQQLRDELLERIIAQDYPLTLRDRRNPRMY
jgi:arylsulfatase A-like enzyme